MASIALASPVKGRTQWQSVSAVNENRNIPYCAFQQSMENGRKIFLSQSADQRAIIFELPTLKLSAQSAHDVKFEAGDDFVVQNNYEVLGPTKIKISLPHEFKVSQWSSDGPDVGMSLWVDQALFSYPVFWDEISDTALITCLQSKKITLSSRDPSAMEAHRESEASIVLEPSLSLEKSLDQNLSIVDITDQKDLSDVIQRVVDVPDPILGRNEAISNRLEGKNIEAPSQVEPSAGVLDADQDRPLTESERDLFESMKVKLFLLEREKEAARQKLTEMRREEVDSMRLDIGGDAHQDEQAEKIQRLKKKLEKYEYGSLNPDEHMNVENEREFNSAIQGLMDERIQHSP